MRGGAGAFGEPLAWCCSPGKGWSPTDPTSHLPAPCGCSRCGDSPGPLVELRQGPGLHFPLPTLPAVTVQEAENADVDPQGLEKHHASLTLGCLCPQIRGNSLVKGKNIPAKAFLAVELHSTGLRAIVVSGHWAAQNPPCARLTPQAGQ